MSDSGVNIRSTKLFNLDSTKYESISTFRAEVIFEDGTKEYIRGMYRSGDEVFYNVEVYEDMKACREKYVRLEMDPEYKVRSTFKIVDVDFFNVENFGTPVVR